MSGLIPRSEYPRPQFQRKEWINLNGRWSFDFDNGKSGQEQEWEKCKGFPKTITVPFCPESRLSGVGYTDFIEAMWYHRKITIPAEWKGKRIFINFGGADYESEVYLDGFSMGIHKGGSASFSVDLTHRVSWGEEQNLVVRIKDELRSKKQGIGKQSDKFNSYACSYTRTTGIWQTVWIEALDPAALSGCGIIPDLDRNSVTLIPEYLSYSRDCSLEVKITADGSAATEITVPAGGNGIPFTLELSSTHPWSPENPFLYDLELTVKNSAGDIIDQVSSYFGLRKVHIEGDQVFLNNKPYFQRLVLDQGFYPDGIWTAPTDEDLKKDIELSKAAGFNGARLHQKVFEERFHYWADKLGYLTWGESASWGMDVSSPEARENFTREWREIVLRDRNHPSIITWTPLNETWHHDRQFQIDLYNLTRSLDPTRPVNEASGYVHIKTDLWTVHNYTQDPEKLKEELEPKDGNVWKNFSELETEYTGQPYIVDEFGGIKWIDPADTPFAKDSWGYGEGPQTEEEFYKRLEGQIRVLVENPKVCGFCYTQLTDVEQEQNGLYKYNRDKKFDTSRLKSIIEDQTTENK